MLRFQLHGHAKADIGAALPLAKDCGMRFLAQALTTAVFATTTFSPAFAEPIADGGITAAELATILQDKGYRAEIDKVSNGDPKIITSTEGSTVDIFFYTCRSGRCAAIQFYSGFSLDKKMTTDQINKWNTNHRFGRGYLNDEGQPRVEMDLDVEHGFTREAIVNNLETWTVILSRFKTFLKCIDNGKDDCT